MMKTQKLKQSKQLNTPPSAARASEFGRWKPSDSRKRKKKHFGKMRSGGREMLR